MKNTNELSRDLAVALAERNAMAASLRELVNLHHDWTRGRAHVSVAFERQNDAAIAKARATLAAIGGAA